MIQNSVLLVSTPALFWDCDASSRIERGSHVTPCVKRSRSSTNLGSLFVSAVSCPHTNHIAKHTYMRSIKSTEADESLNPQIINY
jgi:hypothetical protein